MEFENKAGGVASECCIYTLPSWSTASPNGVEYIQIAAVLAAGIFLGVLLGKHADINSFNSKQSRENHALIELREKMHLSDDYSFGRL